MNKKLIFNRFMRGMMLLALGATLPVGAQTFSTLHNFGTVPNDGQTPQAALAASGSKLYGSASGGGTNGGGMIFSINTDGSGFTSLYSFSAGSPNSDGRAPNARLLVSGNTLYGVCAGGGAHGNGTVFRVNTDGSSFTNLHSFAAFGTGGGGELEFGEGPNSDGAFPVTTLTLIGTNLYGVAQDGGANGNGTIFRVSTDGSSFGVIHTFSGSPNGITNYDGGNPFGNLVLSRTTLYGTTLSGGTMGNGTIYNISIIDSTFTTMHSFGGQIFTGPLAGQIDGIEPGAGLVLSPDGNLYGTCENGGENSLGTVFSIPTNSLDYGNYETLYAWTAQSVGQQPLDDLVLLGTNLFGTTVDGGTNYNGTLFSVSTDGQTFTEYYEFAAYNNGNSNPPNTGGARPYGGFVFAGTNLYGTALDGGTIGYGTVFKLTVPPAILASYLASSLPQIQTDVQTPFYANVGGTVSNSVTVTSPTASGYHWQFNGANLTDNANITGSHSNILTLSNVQANEAGNYQVIITNVAGSITSSVAALTVVGSYPIGFYDSGFDWTANQSGTFTSSAISGNVLTLTDGGGDEARGFFFNNPEYVGGFKASFTYQDVGGGSADGVAFVLQNDSRGTSALGSVGGDLGVGGDTNAITPSAELELNLYTGNGQNMGYAFLTNGLTGATGANGNYHPPGSINLAGGNPVEITMYYAQPQLMLAFTDTVAHVSFSTNLIVGNLTNVVGGATAYIGFTGADGGVGSTQTISNFSFTSVPSAGLGISSTNAVISWPASVIGYTLQKNASLGTANWVNVTNQATVLNGQNRITVPMTTTTEFYRLILQ